LPDPGFNGAVIELTQNLQAAGIDFDAPACGRHSWIARRVWQTAEGQRTSDWAQGPPFGKPCNPDQPIDAPAVEFATLKAKDKSQFRLLWANHVFCYLYEPAQRSTHTRMEMTREREVPPGRQVIGGKCWRDHGNMLIFGTTPWTENEVGFWLEADLQAGRRYRIGLAEMKRNLSFRCVTLYDRETDEELDRFCIPAPNEVSQDEHAPR
jgi:hypothetical protein